MSRLPRRRLVVRPPRRSIDLRWRVETTKDVSGPSEMGTCERTHGVRPGSRALSAPGGHGCGRARVRAALRGHTRGGPPGSHRAGGRGAQVAGGMGTRRRRGNGGRGGCSARGRSGSRRLRAVRWAVGWVVGPKWAGMGWAGAGGTMWVSPVVGRWTSWTAACRCASRARDAGHISANGRDDQVISATYRTARDRRRPRNPPSWGL